MRSKLNIKDLVIGMVLGVIVTVALGAGAGSADADRFGIAIEKDGWALVRSSEGSLYVVDPDEGMAAQVMVFSSLNSNPNDRRSTSKGAVFNLEGPSRTTRTGTRY